MVLPSSPQQRTTATTTNQHPTQLCPTTSRDLPGARLVLNLDVSLYLSLYLYFFLFLTKQLCPTTSRGLPGGRSLPNLDVQPLQLAQRPLLVGGPGWPLQHGLSSSPTLPSILLLSFIRFDIRFSLERGTKVYLIAETRKDTGTETEIYKNQKSTHHSL